MDDEMKALKEAIEAGRATEACTYNYLVQDGRLYYLSDIDEEVRPRLYIARSLWDRVLKHHHDAFGHMGITKMYGLISRKYYWPALYKEVTTYVNSCITCQARADKYTTAPLVETDIPANPFEISLDISGPYGEPPRGNNYIVSFIDWLTNWPEAYAVKVFFLKKGSDGSQFGPDRYSLDMVPP